MSTHEKGIADGDRQPPLDPNNSHLNYTISPGVDRNKAICAAFVAAVIKRREMDRIKGRRGGQ